MLPTNRFTITDLLVTLALVAVLASIGAPFVLASRAKAKASQCATQQRQLYVAADAFVGDRGRLPEYGDTNTSYLDVLEGQAVDGEFGLYLRNYAGVDTVAEGMIEGDESRQLAIGDWGTSLVHCPAASFQRKWWYQKYHHAMAPWETLDYRFSGLNVYAGSDSPFGDRSFCRATEPTQVVFMQDNAFANEASEAMSEIFGEARENNHQYSGLNVMTFDGSARWMTLRETTALRSLSDDVQGGYYRTSQPEDGQMQWWQTDLRVLPTGLWNTAPGLRVYNPRGQRELGRVRHYSYASERVREANATQLATDAESLGYTLREESRRRPQAD